jgi:hypothetical protein
MILTPSSEKKHSVRLTEGQLLQVVGEASMCWNPPPVGKFDSLRAVGIVKRALRGQIQDSLPQGGSLHGGDVGPDQGSQS